VDCASIGKEVTSFRRKEQILKKERWGDFVKRKT